MALERHCFHCIKSIQKCCYIQILCQKNHLKIPNDKKIENLNSIKLNNLSYLESSKDLIDKISSL